MKALIGAMLIALSAVPASAQNLNSNDPQAFAEAMTILGYLPSAIEMRGDSPVFVAEVDGFNTAFAFGGCVDGKQCAYVVLVSGLTDVNDPPEAWLNRMNKDYDLGKVWVDDDGSLSLAMPVPAGRADIPAPMMRFVLEQWRAFVQAISQSAIDEDLVD